MALDLGGIEDAVSVTPSEESNAMSGISGFDDLEPFGLDSGNDTFWIEDDLMAGSAASSDNFLTGIISKEIGGDNEASGLGKKRKTLKSVAQSIRALSRASVRMSKVSLHSTGDDSVRNSNDPLAGGDLSMMSNSGSPTRRMRRETITGSALELTTPIELRGMIDDWIKTEGAGVNLERVKKIKQLLESRKMFCTDFFTPFSSSVAEDMMPEETLMGAGLAVIESLSTFKSQTNGETKISQGFEILTSACYHDSVIEHLTETEKEPYAEATLSFLKEQSAVPSFFALKFVIKLSTEKALPCCSYIISHADSFPLKVTETALVTVAEEALDGNLSDASSWTSSILQLIDIFVNTTLNDEILALALDVLDWAILEGATPFLTRNGIQKLHRCVAMSSKEMGIKESTVARMLKLLNPNTLGVAIDLLTKRDMKPLRDSKDESSGPFKSPMESDDVLAVQFPDKREGSSGSPLVLTIEKPGISPNRLVEEQAGGGKDGRKTPSSPHRESGNQSPNTDYDSPFGGTKVYTEAQQMVCTPENLALIEESCGLAMARYNDGEGDAPVLEEANLVIYSLTSINPHRLTPELFAMLCKTAKVVAGSSESTEDLLKQCITTLLLAYKLKLEPPTAADGATSDAGGGVAVGNHSMTSAAFAREREKEKEVECGILAESPHMVDLLALGIRKFQDDLGLAQRMFRALYPCCATEPVRTYLITGGEKNEFFPSVLIGSLEATSPEFRTGCMAMLMRVCRSHPAACAGLLLSKPGHIKLKPRLNAALLAEAASPDKVGGGGASTTTGGAGGGNGTSAPGGKPSFADALNDDPMEKEIVDVTGSPFASPRAGPKAVLPLLRRLIEGADTDTATHVMLLIRSVAKFLFTKSNEGADDDSSSPAGFMNTPASPRSSPASKPMKMDKRETIALLKCVQEAAERFMKDRSIVAISAVTIGHLTRTTMCKDVALTEIGTLDFGIGLAKQTQRQKSRGSLGPVAFEAAMGRKERRASESGMLPSPARAMLHKPSLREVNASHNVGFNHSQSQSVFEASGVEDRSSGFIASGFLLACLAAIGGDDTLTVVSEDRIAADAVKSAAEEKKHGNVLSRDERAVAKTQASLIAKKERDQKAAEAAKDQQEDIGRMAANVEKAMQELKVKSNEHALTKLSGDEELKARGNIHEWEGSIRELLYSSFYAMSRELDSKSRRVVDRIRQIEATELHVRNQVIESLEQEMRQSIMDAVHRVAMKQLSQHNQLLEATLKTTSLMSPRPPGLSPNPHSFPQGFQGFQAFDGSGVASPREANSLEPGATLTQLITIPVPGPGSSQSTEGPPGAAHTISPPAAGVLAYSRDGAGSASPLPVRTRHESVFFESFSQHPDGSHHGVDPRLAAAASIIARQETTITDSETHARAVLEECEQDGRHVLFMLKMHMKNLAEMLVAQNEQRKRRTQMWTDERQELEDEIRKYRSKIQNLQRELDEQQQQHHQQSNSGAYSSPPPPSNSMVVAAPSMNGSSSPDFQNNSHHQQQQQQHFNPNPPQAFPATLLNMMEMVAQTQQSVKELQSHMTSGGGGAHTPRPPSSATAGGVEGAPEDLPPRGVSPAPPASGAAVANGRRRSSAAGGSDDGGDQWAIPIVKPLDGGITSSRHQSPAATNRPSSAMARMRAGTPSSQHSAGGGKKRKAKPQLERIKMRLTSQTNNLQYIDLSRSYLADAGLFFLIPAIRGPNLPHLSHLSLRQNGITNTYVQHLLFGVLLDKPYFTLLDLAYNKEISPRAGKDFVLFAREKRTLTVLDLEGTQIFNSTLSIIDSVLEERRQLQGIVARETAESFQEDQRYVSTQDV